ncbi:TPA: hypothetical protein DD425_00230 [Candidatus Saccharibacteria bacterium]|nr:hypothetical protein [Candidatus Saccharibacteria bacterium]|tara:strand:- start:725 stop:2023 length:1299 start_codon:yes stop_codon:yes gene_type:complete
MQNDPSQPDIQNTSTPPTLEPQPALTQSSQSETSATTGTAEAPVEPSVAANPFTASEPLNDNLQQSVTTASTVLGDTPIVPTAPTGSSSALDAPATPPKKKKVGLIAAIIAAGVLVVFGGAAAAAYTFWYQNPDKVVGDAIVNAITAETIAATGEIDFSNDSGTAIQLKAEAKAQGGIGELDVEMDYTYMGTSYSVAGTGIISEEGDLYVKLDDVQELADIYLGLVVGAQVDTSPLVEKIEGTWIKITNDDLGTFSEDFAASQACYDDLASSLSGDSSWANELGALYRNNLFVIIEDELEAKSVNGVDSLGYTLGFDDTKMTSFITGLADTQFGKKLNECNDGDANYKDVADSLIGDEDRTSVFNVWISRFGHEFTELSLSDDNVDGKGEIIVNPVFNQPVEVVTPTESMTLEELMADLQAIFVQSYTSASY